VLGGSGSVSQIAFGIVLIVALAVRVSIAKRARGGSAADDTSDESGAAAGGRILNRDQAVLMGS
jgi:hypothetical protein